MNEPGTRPGHPHRRRAIVTRQPVIGGGRVAVVRPRYGRETEPEIPIGLPPQGRRYRAIALIGCVAVLVFAAMGAGSYFIYNSNLLRVNVAEVEGAALTNPHEIAGTAALFQDSMLTADFEAAEDRIRQMPLVQDASIERSWPRTIRITVVERQPWGTWEQAGVAYTIDREGVVLGTTIAAPAGAPVIRSSEQGSRIQGDRVDRHAVDAAARLFADLPGRLGVGVTEVAFLAGKGVQVTTDDGQVALLGDASGIDYKLATWAAMSAQADEEGIVYRIIDLRFGNRPVLVQ
jgi:cell division protein FtsQ